jgi:hypothetical protein
VTPCHPGTSYRPSTDAHQELLAEALALEVRATCTVHTFINMRVTKVARVEKAARVDSIISGEFSELTKSVLKDDEVRRSSPCVCQA